MVNIPAAQVEAVENGVVVRAIPRSSARSTGRRRSSTARSTRSTSIPYWTVPESIIKQGPDPDDAEGSATTLTDYHIRIYDQTGNELQPDADQLEHRRGDRSYLFRQDPGDNNSLGTGQDQLLQPGRRVHARHAAQGPVQRRVPLRFVGLRAHPEHPRADHLAAPRHARLEPRADRRRRSAAASAST